MNGSFQPGNYKARINLALNRQNGSAKKRNGTLPEYRIAKTYCRASENAFLSECTQINIDKNKVNILLAACLCALNRLQNNIQTRPQDAEPAWAIRRVNLSLLRG